MQPFTFIAGAALLSAGTVLGVPVVRRSTVDLPASLQPYYPAQTQFAVPVTPGTGGLPFDKIIGFGDDFTDDGRGSYAHHLTGSDGNSNMWGYATFTDGPVAITYLSQMIGKPVAYNYAFGSSDGAQYVGSVCQNRDVPDSERDGHAMISDGRLVPAARQQVGNYTSGAAGYRDGIDTTLHFFWTGNNDVIASLYQGGRFVICDEDELCLPSQADFTNEVLGCFEATLTRLVKAGARHVLVPNIYPRHLTPWTSMWISPEAGMIANFGALIDGVNAKIASTISAINAAHGSNVMYYDVNALVKKAYADPATAGVQGGYTDTCVDGCKIQGPAGESNWDTWTTNTFQNSRPDNFLWMTEIMPSTTVHKAIAADMVDFLLRQSY